MLVDHQVLYGRRGTGKTHALKYLASEVGATGDLAVYLDLRTIGSSGGLYSDEGEPISERGSRLLVDVLEAIHEALFERSVLDARFEGALPYLDALGQAASEVRIMGPISLGSESQDSHSDSRQAAGEVSIDVLRPQLTLGGRRSKGRQRKTSSKTTVQKAGDERTKLSFGSLSRALNALCEGIAPARLWLLLDEWSSLPLDLQPLLADMLRRTFFPSRNITVKLGAIERRSRFFRRTSEADYLGIELGADTAAALNLDEHLIAAEAGVKAEVFFSNLIYRHLSVLMETLGRQINLVSAADLAITAFAPGAMQEFVRAAEGVPRDAINILGLAAARASDRSISVADIRAAARQFYVRDKETGIAGNTRAQQEWGRLKRQIVVARGSRTFLVRRRSTGTPKPILDLYDARLIHLLQAGLSTRRRPDEVFDGYAVDYGSYIQVVQEDEIAALWESRNRPWEYHPSGAILPDRFDENTVFDVSSSPSRADRY